LRQIAAVADAGHIGGQGVKPNVEDVLAFAGNRDAPLDRSPRDRKIAQPAADERSHLIAARLGLDELGVLSIEFQQAVFESRELEEEVFLGDRLRRAAAVGAGTAGAGLGHVELAVDAIRTLVLPLIDVAVLATAIEKHLDRAVMLRVGG